MQKMFMNKPNMSGMFAEDHVQLADTEALDPKAIKK